MRKKAAPFNKELEDHDSNFSLSSDRLSDRSMVLRLRRNRPYARPIAIAASCIANSTLILTLPVEIGSGSGAKALRRPAPFSSKGSGILVPEPKCPLSTFAGFSGCLFATAGKR